MHIHAVYVNDISHSVVMNWLTQTHEYFMSITTEDGKRSINPTYPKVGQRFTVASPVSSSTAARLRSLRPSRHMATAPVRGAATYRAPGR